MTPSATSPGLLPPPDALDVDESADVTRLLRIFGRRALFLAALALLAGMQPLALILAMAGLALLVAPISDPPGRASKSEHLDSAKLPMTQAR